MTTGDVGRARLPVAVLVAPDPQAAQRVSAAGLPRLRVAVDPQRALDAHRPHRPDPRRRPGGARRALTLRTHPRTHRDGAVLVNVLCRSKHQTTGEGKRWTRRWRAPVNAAGSSSAPIPRTARSPSSPHRLCELKEAAGDPSYDRMRAEFGAAASKSALSAAAGCRDLPSRETTWEFVRSLAVNALGQDAEDVRRKWTARAGGEGGWQGAGIDRDRCPLAVILRCAGVGRRSGSR